MNRKGAETPAQLSVDYTGKIGGKEAAVHLDQGAEYKIF